MDEAPLFTFIEYNFLLIGFVLIVKLVLFFFLRLKKPSLKSFLYFSDSNLRGTKSIKRRKQKVLQNILSIIIIFLLLLQLVVFMGGALVKRKPPE